MWFLKLIDLNRLSFVNRLFFTHKGAAIRAKLCVVNLYIFMDFVACCYSEKYNEIITPFDASLLDKKDEPVKDTQKELDFEKLLEENAKLKASSIFSEECITVAPLLPDESTGLIITGNSKLFMYFLASSILP